jgi:hypothetical protein
MATPSLENLTYKYGLITRLEEAPSNNYPLDQPGYALVVAHAVRGQAVSPSNTFVAAPDDPSFLQRMFNLQRPKKDMIYFLVDTRLMYHPFEVSHVSATGKYKIAVKLRVGLCIQDSETCALKVQDPLRALQDEIDKTVRKTILKQTFAQLFNLQLVLTNELHNLVTYYPKLGISITEVDATVILPENYQADFNAKYGEIMRKKQEEEAQAAALRNERIKAKENADQTYFLANLHQELEEKLAEVKSRELTLAVKKAQQDLEAQLQLLTLAEELASGVYGKERADAIRSGNLRSLTAKINRKLKDDDVDFENRLKLKPFLFVLDVLRLMNLDPKTNELIAIMALADPEKGLLQLAELGKNLITENRTLMKDTLVTLYQANLVGIKEDHRNPTEFNLLLQGIIKNLTSGKVQLTELLEVPPESKSITDSTAESGPTKTLIEDKRDQNREARYKQAKKQQSVESHSQDPAPTNASDTNTSGTSNTAANDTQQITTEDTSVTNSTGNDCL